MLAVERLDLGRAAADQGGGDELRKLQDGEFFRVVAQRPWAVEHRSAFALGLLQQMGGVEIFAVEGRILAHQHRIDIA